jgi:glycosyltransferase involved in cell wall biosynthesis
MRKVICVHLLNDFSGSPKMLASLVRELRRHQVEVDLLTSRRSDGFLSGLDVCHRPFTYRRSGGSRLATLLSLLWSQAELFVALLRYRREKVTVCVNTLLPFGAALAARLMGQRVVYYVHETSLRPALLKRFLRFVATKTSSAVVFVSRDLQDRERLPGIPAHCVPNFLPDEQLEAGRRSEYRSLRDGRFRVLMICSLRDYKGVPEFLMVARQLVAEASIEFELLVNSSNAEVAGYFVGRDLPPNVRLFTRTRDVDDFYRRSSLVLNLSRPDECVETFGLTILEAMAFGVPVIVPPVGGPAELVEDRVEGYLLNCRATDAVAQRIAALAADPALCMEHSAACRARAERHTRARWSHQILPVFDV